MQLRKFEPILIKGYYCLGLLEHSDLKSACTNNIFFFSFFLFGHLRGSIWALGLAGRCIGVYYCASHQVWWGVISGVCDRKTHPQMSLLTSCKACRTVQLTFLLANVQIGLQTVTQSSDLLLGFSCLNELIKRALPSWSHPNLNWNLSKCWPVAAPPATGAWSGFGGCIASWGFFYSQT